MKGNFDDLMPDDPVMQYAWVDCLRWAIGVPEIVARFAADTKQPPMKISSPLGQLIDEATGRDAAVPRQFVEWFNANIWGVDAVKAMTDRLEKR